ncbi:MAG: DUF933 domain-containing protein [Chloroflexi bacterium]|nr:DUF933 domain-containing protein [Chloroflexota bacterium]
MITVGLVGIRGSGRTEIVELLASGASFSASRGRIDQLINQVTPPDERLENLGSLLDVKETTPAAFTLIDYASVGFGEAGDRQAEWISAVRTANVLAPVIPCFLDGDGPESVGARLEEVSSELIVADLLVVESRLKRLVTEIRRAPRAERAGLEREQALLVSLQAGLDAGKHARAVEVSDQDRPLMAGFGFLTLKPAVVLINTGEDAAADWDRLVETANKTWPYPHTAAAAVSAQIEAEAAQLDSDDRRELLESYGIDGSAVGRVSRAVYEATSTSTAYTWNASQVQAWPVPTGTSAVGFAEMIHSDIARGFISAETVSYDELTEAGGYPEARRQGLVRKEGRDYVVKDGDIVQVLFSR